MIDWLSPEASAIDAEDSVYSLNKAKAQFEVVPLTRYAWLILNWGAQWDAQWLRFAVVRYAYSEADNSDVKVSTLFHGEGPSGNLRECRHTWWGEKGDGYLFYVDGVAIVAAFKELSKYFDKLASPSVEIPE